MDRCTLLMGVAPEPKTAIPLPRPAQPGSFPLALLMVGVVCACASPAPAQTMDSQGLRYRIALTTGWAYAWANPQHLRPFGFTADLSLGAASGPWSLGMGVRYAEYYPPLETRRLGSAYAEARRFTSRQLRRGFGEAREFIGARVGVAHAWEPGSPSIGYGPEFGVLAGIEFGVSQTMTLQLVGHQFMQWLNSDFSAQFGVLFGVTYAWPTQAEPRSAS
jgi:hypothetical protein